MSGQFDAYAHYYDLLYRAKPYPLEAQYVDGLIQSHRPGSRSLLELGSGTGQHAIEFSRLGYATHGIDLSPAMVDLARQNALRAGLELAFEQGDMRSYRPARAFEVVVSLFHVMSYQTSNHDLEQAMRTASDSLLTGGLFVFDCWYGPGVLAEPPSTRIFRAQDARARVLRLSEPLHLPNENRVDVRYEIIVDADGQTSRFEELHSMRYLFRPEVEYMLGRSGFELLAFKGWLAPGEPGPADWNAVFVARKVDA